MKRLISIGPALMSLGLCLAACTPVRPVSDASEAALSAESVSASALAPEAVQLPDGFTGRWDASIAACKATSDMKLVITQTGMTFWESSGQITGVTVNGPDDVTVRAAFSGEGEQWNRDLHLVLGDDGNRLTIDGVARVRCP